MATEGETQERENEAHQRGYVQGVCDGANVAIAKRDEYYQRRQTVAWAAGGEIVAAISALIPGRPVIVLPEEG